jgi:8-oxo-dGTP pyrophosphatase MutT (NUDIX family)
MVRTDKGVAIILKKKGKNQYGILRRDKNWTGWEIPKGHLEYDSVKATVFLELCEEAGVIPTDIIDLESIEPNLVFDYEEEGEKIRSDFKSFLVIVDEDTELSVENNPHGEHEEARFVTRKKALDLLKYEEQKKLLTSVS